MARYKDVDTQPRFLPIDLAQQLQPGTFEHALNHLLDHELVLGDFDARLCNDATGASAYPTALLLKSGYRSPYFVWLGVLFDKLQ